MCLLRELLLLRMKIFQNFIDLRHSNHIMNGISDKLFGD